MTASVDAVHFLAPLRVGSVAIIAAMVNRTFASSMEVALINSFVEERPVLEFLSPRLVSTKQTCGAVYAADSSADQSDNAGTRQLKADEVSGR